ncbi:MAG TPA: hypothetical protein GXX57_10445 [Firmicutes bacterium]|nr:hypothetical protein [Bacillota bacterium]
MENLCEKVVVRDHCRILFDGDVSTLRKLAEGSVWTMTLTKEEASQDGR